MSQILALAAIGAALLAWMRSGTDFANQGYWDISGLLAFLSCCAAVLGEQEELLAWLELERSGQVPVRNDANAQ